MTVPAWLVAACHKPEHGEWLSQLSGRVQDLVQRWSLLVPHPVRPYPASCSWVIPVRTRDGVSAVLKLGLPHMEAEHEVAGLRFWNGDPTVRLFETDDTCDAMLLERCEPGCALHTLPECEQDQILAALLRRIWRSPATPHPFRRLSDMLSYWARETIAQMALWSDPPLVRAGLALFETLSRSTATEVLLATDLHAGNVLQAAREPWLVTDPKPFIGDPAYDATQHLLNCRGRLAADPTGTIRRFADLLAIDEERIRLWTFARLAAEPRSEWDDPEEQALARALAP